MKKLFIPLVVEIFKVLSYLPLMSSFGKGMYSSCLFGIASGFYYGKKYKEAISAYDKALNYSVGMENEPPLNIAFENAYVSLGKMYENGLGTNKDEIKAEEYYLRAGSRELND